jgi:cellulose biosynthesis protein BcsE
MNDSVTPTQTASMVRIGISGLPNLTDCMSTGGLYVLIAETPSARFPILASSLCHAFDDNLTCTVIVPSNPENFIQRVESFGSLNSTELLKTNRFQVFLMQEEFQKKMFRFGADSFVLELEQFAIPKNSYLIFDQADDLLSLHDISLALEQVDVLKKWFGERGVTALLVFSRATESDSGTINALMDSLTGIVRLGGDREGLELTFDYWQSPEGAIAARHFRLSTLDSGLYEASNKVLPVEPSFGEERYSAKNEVLGPEEPHFFYMDPDLGSLAKQMPGVWMWVDTLVGMMHATRNTRSATSIFCFRQDTNLRQLAEAVHTLRLSLGRHAQIVVQEKGASLRYQNEALLLRLGINLVVHRDVPASRLPLLLESLNGQIFNRDVDINFESALASVIPTSLRGYLLPARFTREIHIILERSMTMNIPCAMIVGRPVPGTSMVDAVASIRLSRPGDLFTSDNEFCYLFLNACPQAVMLGTLERIFGKTIDLAFSDIRFLIERDEINVELAALSRAAEQGSLPDYSAISSLSPSVTTPVEQAYRPGPSAPLNPASVPRLQNAHVSPIRHTAHSEPLAVAPFAALPTTKPAEHAVASGTLASRPTTFNYNRNPHGAMSGRKEVPRATRSKPSAPTARPPAK